MNAGWQPGIEFDGRQSFRREFDEFGQCLESARGLARQLESTVNQVCPGEANRD